MNLFLLFSQVISAIKSGDYKTAACAAGRIITTVTCSTQAELLATARAKPMLDGKPDPDAENPEPLTAVELYDACAEFGEELHEACGHSENVCRMGAASNAELTPGNWDAIKAFLLDVLKLFIKRPADWQPAPFPAAPVASGIATPTLAEIEGKPSLPPLSKPSERPKSEASGADEKTSDESGDDEDEPPAEPPAPAPVPKPPAKKPKP